MIVTPLPDVAKAGKGTAFEATKGRLKTVNDIKSGVTDGEHWSFQNCVLTDGTIDFPLKVKNHPDLKHLAGRMVYLESNPKRADSLRIDEYKRKPLLTLTGTGKIAEVTGETATTFTTAPVASNAPGPATAAPGKQAEHGYKPKVAPPEPDAAERIDLARKHCAKLRNLWLICLRTAHSAQRSAQDQLNYQVSDPQLQGLVASLFIQSTRDGVHHNMPTGEIDFQTYTLVKTT